MFDSGKEQGTQTQYWQNHEVIKMCCLSSDSDQHPMSSSGQSVSPSSPNCFQEGSVYQPFTHTINFSD